MSLLVSRDNGVSWDKLLDLDSGKGEFAYPAVVASGPQLHVTYTWKRENIAYWQILLGDAALPVGATMKSVRGKCNGSKSFSRRTAHDADALPGRRGLPALEALVEWYIAHGVSGLFAVCQSSEMFFSVSGSG